MFHGGARLFVLIEIGHDDNARIWNQVLALAAQGGQDFVAALFGQHDVEHDEIVWFVASGNQAVVAVDHPVDAVAGFL